MPEQDEVSLIIDGAVVFIKENLSQAVEEVLNWQSTGLMPVDGILVGAASKLHGAIPDQVVFRIVEGFVSELAMKEYLRLSREVKVE